MGVCSMDAGSDFYSRGMEPSGKESLHRTPSVDDLFAPLWRLEVQQQQPPPPPLFQDSPDPPRKNAPQSRADPAAAAGASSSASDEDQHLEDKKQKRMLSNRESARRSRLRKQQHLEELRSQLLELRAHNSHILGKLSSASQQFQQLTHDNHLLRVHAIDLSRQLQELHRRATAVHPDGLQAFGFGTSHLDPPGVAVGSSTSAYAIVSDVLQQGGL